MVRFSLLLLGVVLGLGAGELALRGLYPSLPSLAPIANGDYTLGPFLWPGEQSGGRPHPTKACEAAPLDLPRDHQDTHRQAIIGSGSKPLARLMVTGDSVADGAGLQFPESFGFKLAEMISKAQDRPIHLQETAHPGAGFCDIIATNLWALDTYPAPDLLVVELFADDLEARAALMIGDELVLLPDRVSSPLGRLLVSKSYIANIAWLAAAPALHRMPQRMILPNHQRFFKRALRDLIKHYEDAGSAVLIMLLPPAGLPHCPKVPEKDSRCLWLKEDLNLMARLMDEGGISYLDLRGVWDDVPLSLIDVERQALESGRLDLGIHPDEAGHLLIAELLLAPALKALGPPQSPSQREEAPKDALPLGLQAR